MYLENIMYYIVLINSYKRMNELGDSYDQGATQRDRLLIIDWRTTAATAKEDHAASPITVVRSNQDQMGLVKIVYYIGSYVDHR